MLIRVDPTSGIALFDQLAGSIRASTMAGTIAVGERLPSARELAASLDINVHTVLRAYQLLRDEGIIELRPGRGAIVTGGPVEGYQALNQAVANAIDEAKKLGVGSTALSALIREAYQ